MLLPRAAAAAASLTATSTSLGALALVVGLVLLACPGAASASEGVVALSGAGLELFEGFLQQVTALGIWGPVAFIVAVMCAEMIPLFPTQPLALSSGLLFGAQAGAVYQLIAVTLAAGNAFLVARTVGRSLAERVIREELGDAGDSTLSSLSSADGGDEEVSTGGKRGQATSGGGLARATRAIEEGGPFKQFTAVLLLRLTPVVPYSASNYLLGLTPLAWLPYLGGTVCGMLPWTVLYASVGGASRRLLQRGVSIDLLMQDLSERAARMSGDAAGVAAALVAAAAAAYAVSQYAWPRDAVADGPSAADGGIGGASGGGGSGSSSGSPGSSSNNGAGATKAAAKASAAAAAAAAAAASSAADP
jgi:uncharacterized membrane protein YdjX (TVP38/TMEM64 family)